MLKAEARRRRDAGRHLCRRSAAATCRCSSRGLPIFSQAYYATRPFDESTLDIPLGCGRTRSAKFEVNRFIEFERVKDWWGADLPVNRGSYNFDTVRYDFYRDRDVAFEGFTGKQLSVPRGIHLANLGDALRFSGDHRWPRQARDASATKRRRARRAGSSIPVARSSGIRGCAKRSINAFDFEWTNKTIMYGAYVRTHSPFQNSDMMAIGPPSPEELALLEPFRGKVPDEVFGQPFVPPVSDGSGQDRTLLRKAVQLLQDAGCVIKDGKRMTPQGEAFRIEFLLDEPSFQAASHALYQESGHARHRGDVAAGRSGAVPRAAATISTST